MVVTVELSDKPSRDAIVCEYVSRRGDEKRWIKAYTPYNIGVDREQWLPVNGRNDRAKMNAMPSVFFMRLK